MPTTDSIATAYLPADSVATSTDSASVAAPHSSRVAPWDVCRADEAPLTADERQLFTRPQVSYLTGLAPQPRNHQVATDSGILTLIIMMFLLVAFNFKHCTKMFHVLGQELLSVRRRANVFDDSTTNETRVLVVLLFQLWVCEGLLLYACITGFCGLELGSSIFIPIVSLSAFALLFYLAQLSIYAIVGYTFTDTIGTSQWLKGYNSSQALLGICLLIPALVTIFYPSASTSMIVIAATLYVASRIIFIIKGFRIFYHNFPSLLYFILYLCALEIVPVLIAGSSIFTIGNNLQ